MFKNAAGYIFIGFLPVAANFLLAPVYAAFLPPADYALVGLAVLFQTFLTFFLSLSLDSAFSRLYFNYERRAVLKHAMLGTLLLTVIAVTLVVTVILALTGEDLFRLAFSDNRFTFRDFGYWVLATTFCNVIFLFFVMLHRNEGKMKKFITANILFFIFPVAGSLIGLIGFSGGATAAVIGRSIGSIAFCIVLLGGYFIKHPPVFKKRFLARSLRFSLPLIPYQLMFAAFSNIDRFVVQHQFSPTDFGIYSFAVMITGVIPVFLNAFSNSVTPAIFRTLTEGKDLNRVRQLNHLSIYAGTAVICICIAVAVPLMSVLLGKEYRAADIYIGTLFLSYLPYLHYLVYNNILFYHNKTAAFPIIAFFALAGGLVFDYYLITDFGIWAVCFSLYFIRFIQGFGGYVYSVRFNLHKLEHVAHPTAVIASFVIVSVYNVFLILYLNSRSVNIALLNIIPLLTFAVLCLSLYKKETIYLLRNGVFKFIQRR